MNQDISSFAFWKENGLLVRKWTNVIQDLNSRPRIRRLITGLDAYNPNSQETYIRQKLSDMYSTEKISIKKFNFKNQRASTVNYVLEIETTTGSTVHDFISDYCSTRYIKIRP